VKKEMSQHEQLGNPLHKTLCPETRSMPYIFNQLLLNRYPLRRQWIYGFPVWRPVTLQRHTTHPRLVPIIPLFLLWTGITSSDSWMCGDISDSALFSEITVLFYELV